MMQRKTTNPHARLVALAADLRAGTLDAEDREQLAEVIVRVALGEDATAALGLKRRPGQRLWSTTEALAERDRLLREAVVKFFPGLSTSAQARELHAQMLRYHSSGWQYERSAAECPSRHTGRLCELLWLALRQVDRMLSERTLRSTLSGS